MKLKNRTLRMGLGFLILLLNIAAANPGDQTQGQKSHVKPVALVYDGPGACVDGCARAAADMAYQAGFHPIIVGPQAITESYTPDDIKAFFENVKVWIQPGGYSKEAYQAMNPKLRESLLNFIFGGGGYVGFCAGAFITTNQIGTTGTPGFSIFPGRTAPLNAPTANPNVGFSIQEITWNGRSRAVYFEGGPYMYNLPSQVEVIATYSNGKVAAARTSFGLGRVFITGAHPEAPRWWSAASGVWDHDGLEHDLAVDMIRWATKSPKFK